MSYKNITALTDTGNGSLAIAQVAIEPCAAATTGWGIMTPGDPDPINADEQTDLMGWGKLDGPAIVHGAYRIPLRALPNAN